MNNGLNIQAYPSLLSTLEKIARKCLPSSEIQKEIFDSLNIRKEANNGELEVFIRQGTISRSNTAESSYRIKKKVIAMFAKSDNIPSDVQEKEIEEALQGIREDNRTLDFQKVPVR